MPTPLIFFLVFAMIVARVWMWRRLFFLSFFAACADRTRVKGAVCRVSCVLEPYSHSKTYRGEEALSARDVTFVDAPEPDGTATLPAE